MTRKPKALASLAEDPSSVPNTHQMANNWESVTFHGYQIWAFMGARYGHGAYTYCTGKTFTYMK